MTVKVENLMTHHVVTVEPHHTVSHVQKIFKNNRFNILPVVSCGKVIGVVAPSDLLGANAKSPISSYMSTDLITIPPYSNVDVAAKLMKKNKIHHLVVTLEKELMGVLSSFDLLDLIDEHKFKSTKREGKTKMAA